MIIYNVTVKVEGSISESWLNWLLKEHIPAILATRCFYAYKVVRLLETDETEGPTYAIQYTAENMEAYKKYIENYASEFRNDSIKKWGDAFIAFRSVMEVIA